MVTDVTANSARLTWNSGNADPVQSYVVQYRHKYAADGLYDEIFDVVASDYSVLGLGAHTAYEFRVVAVNAIGRSLPSTPVDVTTGELSTYTRQVFKRDSHPMRCRAAPRGAGSGVKEHLRELYAVIPLFYARWKANEAK